ncbi:MAG: methyltransferase domain-containing protein [Alphaproteobacteria bacterium]|nr:methyltransferase domain-containing protein [Alphaproteobacteria bacterium]
MSDTAAPFDRRAVRAHRDRAAAKFSERDFLFRETADRLMDRLGDIRRKFPVLLDLGCHAGDLGARLKARDGAAHIVQCDLSPKMAGAARDRNGIATIAADEEALPFAPSSFDLITSNLSLHWVNDLPGALLQARKALKPDGLFLGCLLGGTTLSALRAAFMEAELSQEGGVSPRVSPFADVRDGGDLMARAGFALPVADLDTIRVSFPDALHLMRDLQGMGEANAVTERRKAPTRRATIMETARLYPHGPAQEGGQEESQEGGENNRIEARFDVIWLAGWAPGPGQPKPLAPGSATARLADALNTEELRPGDTTPRPKGR